MLTYALHLLIDPHDLRRLQTTRRTIVLARPVNDANMPNVVWQTFAPRTDNVVTWTDAYGLYAAKPPLVHGAQLIPTRSLPYPACPASAYTLAPDATFHGPYYGGGMLGPNQFCVTNDISPAHFSSLIFGLAQDAIINGLPGKLRPINAQAVPAHQRVVFTPGKMVYLWLHAGVMSGTVITEMPAKVTAVNVDRCTTVQTLKYDATHDTFVPYSYGKHEIIPTLPKVTGSGFAASASARR